MEPVRPKRGSKGSISDKSNSRPSSRGSSHKSSKGKVKSKRSSPADPDKEVTFGEEADTFQGYKVDYTDSDETDLERDHFEMELKPVADHPLEEEHLEPYIDEEAMKAELGGVDLNFVADTEDKDESKNAKSTEDEDESETTATTNKKNRRLKRVTEKRIGFDGREVIFVTECSQTDWKWKDKTEKTGRGLLITPSVVKPDSRMTLSQARTDEDSQFDDRTGTDLTPFSLQPNDEFGIPLLDMSSDSDSSDDEQPRKKNKTHRHHLPSIGPPQILKYIRESDRMDTKDSDRSSCTEDEFRQTDSVDVVYDQDGNVAGMFSGPCEFCGNDIKAFPTLEQQLALPPDSLYCCEDYREFVEFAMNTANRLEQETAKKNEKINVKVHGHHGSKQARKMAKEQAVQRMRERELQRRQQEATGLQTAHYNSSGTNSQGATARKTNSNQQANNNQQLGGALFKDLARQMKTINYQLSSQKCLEEGWTLRAPSPLDFDDADEVFIPEPLNPAMIASGKVTGRGLIEKFYPDESKFLTIFPDGTGNIFYPSGRLAIMIISVSLGQYTYIIQDDAEEPEILAVFEPTGHGTCYFANGQVRLTYDQYSGMELDYSGAKKRVWCWRDQETHVHAPPFQPIVFRMNRYMGVRFLGQEKIALTLTGKKRSCRFNVGSKLKLVAPENILPKAIDENQLFIDERTIRVDFLLSKVSSLLKFPKSPKVDRILPPLSVSARQHKMEKMKHDYAASLAVPATVPTRRQKKIVKSNSRLSPLPSISVN